MQNLCTYSCNTAGLICISNYVMCNVFIRCNKKSLQICKYFFEGLPGLFVFLPPNYKIVYATLTIWLQQYPLSLLQQTPNQPTYLGAIYINLIYSPLRSVLIDSLFNRFFFKKIEEDGSNKKTIIYNIYNFFLKTAPFHRIFQNNFGEREV